MRRLERQQKGFDITSRITAGKFLLVAVILGMFPLQARAVVDGLDREADAGNVVCSPDTLFLTGHAATGTVAVDYLGGASAPVYGYSITFSWDPTVASTTTSSVIEGALLSNQGVTQFYANASGPSEITVDCALLGSQPGVSDPGTLFSIEFTRVAAGASPLDLTVLLARDASNNPLTGLVEEDGVIVVEDCQPPADVVDIGNPASELGHNLTGWGPIEPANTGGNYGGIEDCRAVYASAANGDGEDWATVDLFFGSCDPTEKCLELHHLDGAANDAFDLYIYPSGQPEASRLIYRYAGDGQTAETWYKTTVPVVATGLQTLRFVSTEPVWSGWPTYGQMCFDTLRVRDCLPTTAVPRPDGEAALSLRPVRPNPTRQNAVLAFSLAEQSPVRSTVHDVSGRVIRILCDQVLPAGEQHLVWDGRDSRGHRVPAGVYLHQVVIPGRLARATKFVLLQ